MSSQQPALNVLALSDRIYRAILRLYPAQFRMHYELEMACTFRDRCKEHYRRGGLTSLVSLWMPTLFDLLKTAAEQHVSRGGFEMTKSILARISGPAFILAGAMWVLAGFGSVDPYYALAYRWIGVIYEVAVNFGLASLLPILAGCIGLYFHYRARVGAAGHAALIGNIFGAVISAAAFIIAALGGYGWWHVGEAGVLLIATCMIVFGISALHWNALPILIGISGWLLFISSLVDISFPSRNVKMWLGLGVFLAQGLLLALLGYGIMLDTRPEPLEIRDSTT